MWFQAIKLGDIYFKNLFSWYSARHKMDNISTETPCSFQSQSSFFVLCPPPPIVWSKSLHSRVCVMRHIKYKPQFQWKYICFSFQTVESRQHLINTIYSHHQFHQDISSVTMDTVLLSLLICAACLVCMQLMIKCFDMFYILLGCKT